MKVRITESLDIDMKSLNWHCNRCGKELGSAKTNYKEFCLVYERDPETIHKPYVDKELYGGLSLAPNRDWIRIVEFYCPGCGVMFECEYLPPGHPITRDIELDIESLKNRFGKEA
jgi:acetophenone carboxylase